MSKRTIVLMLDSFGIGASEDAHKFGDEGANTFAHIAEAYAAANKDTGAVLHLPHLTQLGLAEAAKEANGIYPVGFSAQHELTGTYGYAAEISTGKDTPSGHWEMAGVPVLFEWGYFHQPHDAFPKDLLDKILRHSGYQGFLGIATLQARRSLLI